MFNSPNDNSREANKKCGFMKPNPNSWDKANDNLKINFIKLQLGRQYCKELNIGH